MQPLQSTGETRRAQPIPQRDEQRYLQRRSWRNWFLLVGVFLITTIGLATAIPPLLNERYVNPWPWARTDLGLLIACSILVTVLAGYLTAQQRQLARLNQRLHQVTRDACERSQRHTNRLFALFGVSRAMGMETNPQTVFDTIASVCVETFGCDQASLMAYDSDGHQLQVRAASGHADPSTVIGRTQKMGEGIAGWVAQNREPLLLNRNVDMSRYPMLELKSPHISAAMVVPIILRDELVGVVNVSSRSTDIDYDEEDLRALQVFAENAGTCIRHAEHVDWLRKTVERLRKQVDPDTAGSAL